MAISVAINTYEEDGLYSGEEVVAVFDAELELTDDAIAVAENGNTSNLAITKVIPSNSRQSMHNNSSSPSQPHHNRDHDAEEWYITPRTSQKLERIGWIL